MPTAFPELFAALAAEFDPTEVRNRKQGGRSFDYITARTAMYRLDTVLGPECWEEDYTPRESSVLCTLTITLPDGKRLSKRDAGAYAGMADEGDDDKSGFSDAFKRAAVKFGVGRYLYGDGVPLFEPRTDPVDMIRPQSGAGLLIWSQLVELDHDCKATQYVAAKGKNLGYSPDATRWSAEQVATVYAAALARLRRRDQP